MPNVRPIQVIDGATCVAYELPVDELVERIERGLKFLKQGDMAQFSPEMSMDQVMTQMLIGLASAAYAEKKGYREIMDEIKAGMGRGTFIAKDYKFGGSIMGVNISGYQRGSNYLVRFALIPDTTPFSTIDGLSAAIGKSPIPFPRGL